MEQNANVPIQLRTIDKLDTHCVLVRVIIGLAIAVISNVGTEHLVGSATVNVEPKVLAGAFANAGYTRDAKLSYGQRPRARKTASVGHDHFVVADVP